MPTTKWDCDFLYSWMYTLGIFFLILSSLILLIVSSLPHTTFHFAVAPVSFWPSHTWTNGVLSLITLQLMAVRVWVHRKKVCNILQDPSAAWSLSLPPDSSRPTSPLLIAPQPNLSSFTFWNALCYLPTVAFFACCFLSLECSDTPAPPLSTSWLH